MHYQTGTVEGLRLESGCHGHGSSFCRFVKSRPSGGPHGCAVTVNFRGIEDFMLRVNSDTDGRKTSTCLLLEPVFDQWHDLTAGKPAQGPLKSVRRVVRSRERNDCH